MEKKNKSSGTEEIEFEQKGKIPHKKVLYNDILFDSKMEVSVYKYLCKRGVVFKYNAQSFELQKGFKPTVPFFVRGTDRKTHREVFKFDNTKVQNMSYTPDFILYFDGGYEVILEVKGKPNERYPIVKKLFRKLLEKKKNKDKLYFAEVKSVRETEQLINIVNDEIFKRNQLAGR